MKSNDTQNPSPVNPREVAWTGENPGIYLKESQDGPWTGLATFFRVIYSPFGMGRGVIVLDSPDQATGYPNANNLCITDNQKLAEYLVNDFFSKFASFRVSPGIGAMTYLSLKSCTRAGDTRTRYQETVRSEDVEVVMTWNELGKPYAVDMPSEKGPTKLHQMYSVFLDSADAKVEVNGKRLHGKVVERDFADTRKSTAFLAFSETWLQIPTAS